MTTAGCYTTWAAAEANQRARALDQDFPECLCETVALRKVGGDPVNDNEVVARILTSPGGYNLETGELLTSRLTSIYGCGLSMVRSGASDDEILATINVLTTGQEELHELVGAVVVSTRIIRDVRDDVQWFGVYSTEDGSKEHHIDVLGTGGVGNSKSAQRKCENNRRYKLRDHLQGFIVFESDHQSLIARLREAGI